MVGCLAAARPGLASALNEPVWLLLSDAGGAYAEAAGALAADWRQANRDRELQTFTVRDLPSVTSSSPPAALITVGSAALRVAMERVESTPAWSKVPVVVGLIPREGFTAIWKRPPATVMGVFLDQPFDRYLDLVRAAFPRLNKVGVLVGPETAMISPSMFKAASDRGLHLSVGRVAHPDSVGSTLRTVLTESDVLVVLPEGMVTDASGLQTILMSAYRQHIPVVAYSPALVKAGAALGLYATPTQVGHQLATVVKAVLAGSHRAPAVQAEGVSVSVNDQVCRSLGLELPDATELTEALKRP